MQVREGNLKRASKLICIVKRVQSTAALWINEVLNRSIPQLRGQAPTARPSSVLPTRPPTAWLYSIARHFSRISHRVRFRFGSSFGFGWHSNFSMACHVPIIVIIVAPATNSCYQDRDVQLLDELPSAGEQGAVLVLRDVRHSIRAPSLLFTDAGLTSGCANGR